ncbi:MAG: hypothetical protein B7X02_00580 [Rhodospirillales bacterium 12-54-5]|nr:MAG: hypothetical protein B7X02_00580 [Rhodospirillales bacterium 12-54-5]
MSALSTSLNTSFAAADALRLAQLQQQLQQQSLPPNSTVTASYKFAVGSDGSLTPTEARIVTKTIGQGEAEGTPNPTSDKKSRRSGDQATNGLSDIARPRAQLSPSDELTIFSSEDQGPGADPSANDDAAFLPESLKNVTNEAASAARNGNTLSLAARAQISAANLYARNADLVYNVNPVIYEAA